MRFYLKNLDFEEKLKTYFYIFSKKKLKIKEIFGESLGNSEKFWRNFRKIVDKNKLRS